ncbi:MAG: hypothetical protein V6Z86_05030 [Hyphomicrobiales bacterium]
MRFEPRFVEFEADTGKLFVSGHSWVSEVSGRETRHDRTYEFVIALRDDLPVIEAIQTYEGKPRTKEVLERMERNRKREEERK